MVGAMFTSSIIYALLSVYMKLSSTLLLNNSFPLSGVTGVFAYALMGFAFRYLNTITNRSTQAVLRILEEESKNNISVTTNGHTLAESNAVAERENSTFVHQPLPSLPLPITVDIRRSLEIRRSIDSKKTLDRMFQTSTISLPNISCNDSIALVVDNSISNNSMTLNPINDNGGGDIENRSNNGGEDSSGVDMRVKPTIINSLTNSTSIHTIVPSISIHNNENDITSLLPRQNSLDRHLADYETAHLLSDKIVVSNAMFLLTSYL